MRFPSALLLVLFIAGCGGDANPVELEKAAKLTALEREIASLSPGDMVLVHDVPHVVTDVTTVGGDPLPTAPGPILLVSAKPVMVFTGESAEAITLSSHLFLASGIRIARKDDVDGQADMILEYLDLLYPEPSAPLALSGTKAA